MKFSKKLISGFFGFFRNHDSYGQGVQLNYGGEDTFKTMPGGIISLGLTVLIFCYSVLRYI